MLINIHIKNNKSAAIFAFSVWYFNFYTGEADSFVCCFYRLADQHF